MPSESLRSSAQERKKNDAIIWSRVCARSVFVQRWRRDCSVPELGVRRRDRLGRPERLDRPTEVSSAERSIRFRRSVCTTPGSDWGPGGRQANRWLGERGGPAGAAGTRGTQPVGAGPSTRSVAAEDGDSSAESEPVIPQAGRGELI